MSTHPDSPTDKDVFAYHVRQIARNSANRWGGPMRRYMSAARVRACENMKDPAYARTVRKAYLRHAQSFSDKTSRKEAAR